MNTRFQLNKGEGAKQAVCFASAKAQTISSEGERALKKKVWLRDS